MLWLVACTQTDVELKPAPVDTRGLSVLLILTDDQRADTLWAMPRTQERLGDEGVSFTRAYATTPMCCPSRASLLSGGWLPAHAGVTTNEAPNGGATSFADEDAIGLRLNVEGVATGLYGKYLNEYDALGDYVPPGWSGFGAVSDPGDWTSWTRVLGENGAGAGTRETGYLTDSDVAHGVSFLSDHRDDPFFLEVAIHAPHYPWVPAAEDETEFSDFAFRPASFDEMDVSDKPTWVQDTPVVSADEMSAHDEDQRDQLRTLLAVDRGVDLLLDTLENLGRDQDTIVVFASDNGYLWGEHRQWGKGLPWEESVRVPLIVRIPGVAPREEAGLVAVNLDLGEALSAHADRPDEADGIDLFAVATGATSARSELFLEGRPSGTPPWAAYVTATDKYIEWMNHEDEHYDLAADPYELTSTDAPPDAALLGRLHASRGLTVYVHTLETAVEGLPYAETLTSWGGQDPVTWQVVGGALPAGVTLGTDGSLSGTPTEAGSFAFTVQVEDASTQPYTGRPERDIRDLTLNVDTLEGAPVVRAFAGGVEVTGVKGTFELSGDGAFERPLRHPGEGRIEGLRPGVWTWRVVDAGGEHAYGRVRVPPGGP